MMSEQYSHQSWQHETAGLPLAKFHAAIDTDEYFDHIDLLLCRARFLGRQERQQMVVNLLERERGEGHNGARLMT